MQDLLLHIESLTEEKKVCKELYTKRLQICDDCEKITDGMCRSCGCFVIYRCIGKEQKCPVNKW